jgi:small conductance mechanosensitive channel
VLASPAPDVDVLEFTPAGPRLCVRPYCSNEHYWQVYFDTQPAQGKPSATPGSGADAGIMP